jgi:hypothetical protein
MLETMPDWFWVAAGALVTFALALALSFWIDREWREIDRRRRSPPNPPASPEPSDRLPPDVP